MAEDNLDGPAQGALLCIEGPQRRRMRLDLRGRRAISGAGTATRSNLRRPSWPIGWGRTILANSGMRLLAAALIVVASMPAPAMAVQHHRPVTDHGGTRTVVLYTGAVDSITAERFMDIVSRSADTVVGLDVVVDTATHAHSRYSAGFDTGSLVISADDPANAPVELVVNRRTGTTLGMARVDGFYLIKSGGMHAAGATSFVADPVDEATLRLNPRIRIIRRSF